MILLDLNQTVIASLMMQIGSNPRVTIDENLVRHIVLNCIRSYSKQFKSKYGELVICCDNKNYWRREVFPFYKSHRKKDREKSDFDWNNIFTVLNKIRDELKEHSPYKVVEVESCGKDAKIGKRLFHYFRRSAASATWCAPASPREWP